MTTAKSYQGAAVVKTHLEELKMAETSPGRPKKTS